MHAPAILCRLGEMEKEGLSLGYPVGAYAEERGIDKLNKTNFGKLQTSCWSQGREVWTNLKLKQININSRVYLASGTCTFCAKSSASLLFY